MQPKTISWADSVRAWASGYKDSVLVDMHYDNDIGFKNIYIQKDHEDSWKAGVKDSSSVASANWQYYVVPSFFAIIVAMVIFAFVLFGDEAKKKAKDSVLDLMKGNDSKKN